MSSTTDRDDFGHAHHEVLELLDGRAIIACSPLPRDWRSTSARKPVSVPRSRSWRTRSRHVDGAAKVAIIVDSELPPGLAANTAAVLALTIGHRVGSLIGCSLKDGDGSVHAGITNTAIPVLAASAAAIKAIRNNTAAEAGDLLVVDFTDCAQRSRTYDDYASLLATSTDAAINYLGVGLHGPAKSINKITGSLRLLR